MSMPSPSAGSLGSPGSETPMSGQGFGLSWQKRRKSVASSRGRITTLPCTWSGAMPLVAPVHSPERIRPRASCKACDAGFIRIASYLKPAPTPLALVILLGVLIALPALGTDLFVPALPSLTFALGAEVGAAQLTMTLYFIGVAAGQLLWGPLSDRYGRKPILFGG